MGALQPACTSTAFAVVLCIMTGKIPKICVLVIAVTVDTGACFVKLISASLAVLATSNLKQELVATVMVIP